MTSGAPRVGSSEEEDVVILSTDDEKEDVGDDGNTTREEFAATTPSGSASAASAGVGDRPIASPSTTTSTSTPSRRTSARLHARKSAASADPAIPVSSAHAPAKSTHARRVASPATKLGPSTPAKVAKNDPARRPETSTTSRGVASPDKSTPSAGNSNRGAGGPSAGVTTPGSTSAHEPTMGPTNFGSSENANRNATTGNEMEDDRATQRRRARKRNTQLQSSLSTPGCVLFIDNLELDVQPQDMLGQLVRFDNNNAKIHSVHVPPPYPGLNHAGGYVVFLKKEYADAAAAFLSRIFVVSARGRPWVISRSTQILNEEDTGFPTISAFKGEGDGGVQGGLKIVTENQEAEYSKAKRRLVVFEEHKKQSQLLFERHAQEEKDFEENPDFHG